MLAKRLATILPPLTLEEALETTKIHSIVGLLAPGQALVTQRPFRAPHHTASDAGLLGGNINPTPGEISLAHHGVLFLDELPEFKRSVLETMRQPLEEGRVTISRAAGTMTFPSQFMLVAAMNPTPDGKMPGESSSTPRDIQRYLGRISGPLLDRIDLHVEVPAVKFREITGERTGETSAQIRERVIAARQRQQERFKHKPKITCNARMGSRELKQYCPLDEATLEMLKFAMADLNFSARAYDRILKVARTIADLAGAENLLSDHISEAIQYPLAGSAVVDVTRCASGNDKGARQHDRPNAKTGLELATSHQFADSPWYEYRLDLQGRRGDRHPVPHRCYPERGGLVRLDLSGTGCCQPGQDAQGSLCHAGGSGRVVAASRQCQRNQT